MAEYWKSIENYYCKFCKTYVKDTPFARNEHEQSDRHRRNLKRFVDKLVKQPRNGARPVSCIAKTQPKTVCLAQDTLFSLKKQEKSNTLDEAIDMRRKATTGLEHVQDFEQVKDWQVLESSIKNSSNFDNQAKYEASDQIVHDRAYIEAANYIPLQKTITTTQDSENLETVFRKRKPRKAGLSINHEPK